MRTITYGGACSLDMYLADPADGVDWLLWTDDAAAISGAYWAKVDTILMGRRTYEIAMARSGGGGQEDSPISTYVFSTTLDAVAPGANLVRENAAEVVRDLKAKSGKEICVMGGGSLARSLFERDLIDEVGLNVHPILLGGGIPAFPPSFGRSALELTEARPLARGCVYLHYRVLHDNRIA